MWLTSPCNSGPAPSQGDEGPELPAYQSTQLLDDSIRLRMRLTNLDSNEDNQSPHLRPVITEFLDHLQNHIGRSASSLPLPTLNGNPDGALTRYAHHHSHLQHHSTPTN